MSGWIKLYRKLSDSPMYKSLTSKQRDITIQVLLMANHEEKEWSWGNKIFNCRPGQFISSLPGIKERCAKDVSIQNIRTCLLILEKWHFLTNRSTKTGRLITICNWSKYQSCGNSEQQTDQQTANRQLTANKKIRNEESNNIAENVEQLRDISLLAEQLKSIVTTSKNIKVNGHKLNGWKKSIRLMVERDGIQSERIENALDWYSKHVGEKFVPVIESGSSLREKFTRLEDAIKRATETEKTCDECDYKKRGHCNKTEVCSAWNQAA